jgi:integrase
MKEYKITRDKFLSTDDVDRLLKVCEEKAIVDLAKGRQTWVTRYMLVHLALHSGLRVSELAGLTIGDLHLNGKDVYLIVQKGKGSRKRDVYLDKQVVAHLKDYLVYKRNVLGESVGDESPFFCGRGGKHFTTTALHKSFKKALEEAKLPKRYSIHSSRHTYATVLLSKTKNLRFVQKQLGHASLDMTSLYADVLPELNQSLANAILN